MREVTSFFSMGKGTGAAANTREVTSFLVWAHKKGKKYKKKEKEKSKKIEGKIKKIEKEKCKKNRKRKTKKRKIKKNLFSVVLDKICVFFLYPIPDSQ